MPKYQSGVSDHLQIGKVGVLFDNERIAAGQASTAFSLQRDRVPFGAAFQVQFSASPGTFQVDIQGSETNDSNSFVTLASISSVNATFAGRYDMIAFFPKYVRINMTTFPNDVLTKAIVTR